MSATQAALISGRFYGRRRGRRLCHYRQHLLGALLPKHRVVLPEQGRTLDPHTLFGSDIREVWLEIGFGGGEFLATVATRHPDIGFIGCEPYVSGVAALLARIEQQQIANIRILDDDGRPLLRVLAEASIARVLLLFPDPWPKQRHANRRLVSGEVLDLLARILQDGGEVWLATDHIGCVRSALELFLHHHLFLWPARGPQDWRKRPAGWVATRYETKALGRGASCVYLRLARRPRQREGKKSAAEARQEPCRESCANYIFPKDYPTRSR